MKLVLSMPGFRTLAQESIETVVKNRLKAKDCVICKNFCDFFSWFSTTAECRGQFPLHYTLVVSCFIELICLQFVLLYYCMITV